MIVTRPETGQNPPPAGPRRRGAQPRRRIRFPFDTPPKFIRRLIRRKRITAFDGKVLEVMLGFRYRVQDSCWTTRGRLELELGAGRMKVYRACRKLRECGLISLRPVATPDPDEPQNKTGWRIDFPWLAPDGSICVPSPGEPPALPEVMPPLHDGAISPPIPEAAMSPESGTELKPAGAPPLEPRGLQGWSPSKRGRAPLGDFKKQDDDGIPPAPEPKAPTPSSLSLSLSLEPRGPEPPGAEPPIAALATRNPATGPAAAAAIAEPVVRAAARAASSRPRKRFEELPESYAALARAETIWPSSPALAGRVEAAVQKYSADWVLAAFDEVDRKRRSDPNPVGWGFVQKTLSNFAALGGPDPQKAPSLMLSPEKRQASADAALAAARADRKRREALDEGSEPATPEAIAEFRSRLKPPSASPAPVPAERPPSEPDPPAAQPSPEPPVSLAGIIAGIRGRSSAVASVAGGGRIHRPPVPIVERPPDADQVRRVQEARARQLEALKALRAREPCSS